MAKTSFSNSLLKARTKISNEFLTESNPRARRRFVQLLEGAIQCYSGIGFEKTTYQKIADACGVTQPLVMHYFDKKADIFALVAKYIRVNFQNLAIDAIESAKSPREMILAYCDSCFEWSKKYPQHAKVWALYYYHCALHSKYKKLNTEMVTTGEKRIAKILELGIEAKEFQKGEVNIRARMIRMIITGMLILDNTEKLPISREDFMDECRNRILKIAARG